MPSSDVTIEKTLESRQMLLMPAASLAPGEDLLVYALDRRSGMPLDEDRVLDMGELLGEFSIGYSALNPSGTLLAIRYGASSAIVQQAIDRYRASESPLAKELTAGETEQYYRLLVNEVSRWEYIMDKDSAYIRADITDLKRPLKGFLDHLNRLEIPYRVEHTGHTDMLVIRDESVAQHLLNVRNSLYEKIAVHNPRIIDLARNLTNCRVLLYARVPSSPDDDAGGEGE